MKQADTPATALAALKPCPFCGGQPTTQEYRSSSDETGEVYGYAAVECNAHGRDAGVFYHCETMAEAIAAWNTRSPSPAEPVALDAVRGAGDSAAVILSKGPPYPQGGIPKMYEHGAMKGYNRPDNPALADREAPAEGVEGERFLTAYVSEDAKVVGIEHDTEADWYAVQRAHEVLRDRLNVRLAERENCPFKPTLTPQAPK